MYLFVFDYESGNIDVVRNVPENIEDLESFVSDTLCYHLSNVAYMLTKGDNVFNIVDYNSDDSITDKGFDYIECKF